jgi:hypothetical protein
MYPHKDDKDIAALERLAHTAYVDTDKPFLFTERYGLSPDFDPADVVAKQRVDMQGAMENIWWLQAWKERGL